MLTKMVITQKVLDKIAFYSATRNMRAFNKPSVYWQLMTGTVVSVKWPSGKIEVGPNSHVWDGVSNGRCRQEQESADPNDHYRPWLEENVGRQGIDWEWGILGDDISANRLSIRFRHGKGKWASMAALRWS